MLGSGTSKVLNECLAVLSSPNHNRYPASNIPSSKFDSHPDIQYFKDIKDKNHFKYHNQKKKPKLISDSSSPHLYGFPTPSRVGHDAGMSSGLGTSTINPYDLASLLTRIATFNVLNWKIPSLGKDVSTSLNELFCARKGWKCIPLDTPNSIIECTFCQHRIQLKFNDITAESSYIPFDFDEDDYLELNLAVAKNYITQIQSSGHESNCLWRIYETPLDGVYYQRPYIEETNQSLKNEYLKNLKGLMENKDILINQGDSIDITTATAVTGELSGDLLQRFIAKSNDLLFEKYYKQDQENSYYQIQLDEVPSWIYRLASLGWNLNVQYFAHHLVLLLICNKCNSRVYLPNQEVASLTHNVLGDGDGSGVSISPSRILTPCKYPPQPINTVMPTIYDDIEDDVTKIDIVKEHKLWCSHLHLTSLGKTLEDLLVEILLLEGAENIESQSSNILLQLLPNRVTKRKPSISESLERLNKLRKIYLSED